MRTRTMIKSILNYLFLSATRGSLEQDMRWYYRQLGKDGQESRVNRGTLETLYFLQSVLDIQPVDIYQILVDGVPQKHLYYSAAEALKFIFTNCPVQVSEEFEDLKTTKGDKPVTLKYITSLKP